MTFSIEVTEEEVKAAVTAEVGRRVRDRIPYNADHIRVTADSRIREVVSQVIAETDVEDLVRKEVRATFDRILADTVRSQVKNIVRLAVHKEVAALKAEVQEP